MIHENKIDDQEKNRLDPWDLIDPLPFGVQIFDSGGYSVRLNRKACEILALYDPAGSIGRFNVLTDPSPLGNGKTVYHRALSGNAGIRIILLKYRRSKKKPKPVPGRRLIRETVFPLADPTETIRHIVSVLEDITEQTATQTRIRDNERFFRLLIENVPDAVFIRQNKFLYLNGNPREMAGNEHTGRHKGSPVPDRFHPDFHELIRKGIEEQNRTGKCRSPAERLFVRLDGTAVEVEVSAIPCNGSGNSGALVFMRDTGDRKARSRLLEQQYDLLANIAAQVPGVIYQYRRYPGGRSCFPYSSHGMFEIFELTPRQVLDDASPVFRRIHPDDRQMILDGIGISSRDLSLFRREFRVILPVRGEGWRLCSAKPERLDDGSTLWHGIVSDITDQKKIRKALVKAGEKARKNDHLKTVFLHNISHVIRTPMNAITGFADLLKERDLSGEKQNDNIEKIITGTRQLLSVINDIITVSKIDTGQENLFPGLVDINSVIGQVHEDFVTQVRKKGLELIAECPLDGVAATMVTDRDKLVLILTKLVSNALKFTDNGTIKLGYHPGRGSMRFYVRDTGIGIDASRHKSIFERFRQNDDLPGNRQGGTGLGLSITRSLVNILGGNLDFESEPGRGSTFHFTIKNRQNST